MRNILCLVLVAACSHSTPAPAIVKPVAEAKPAELEPFDDKVRQDFFDGMGGDTEAMDRAMKVCEETLARNPKHPEAMVWHGAGVVWQARLAFQAGDRAKGIELYTAGLAEMDAAVVLAPTDVGVRIPRGAVVLAMAPHAPEPEKTKLLERGISDYEATLETQRAYFGSLTLHAREQLLYGLTDGYANLGKREMAQASYQRMTIDAAGSELLPRAASRARGEEVAGPTPCVQCHQGM